MAQTVPVEIHVKEVKLDAVHAFAKAVMVFHANVTRPSASVPKTAVRSSAPNAVSAVASVYMYVQSSWSISPTCMCACCNLNIHRIVCVCYLNRNYSLHSLE